MRRVLLAAALAGAAMVLAGCDGGDEGTAQTTATDDVTTDDAAAASGDDQGATTTEDGAPPPDDTAATTGEVEGGEEGQAAADVAEKFLIAMVNADDEACDYMLSFTDLQKPMTEVESDLEMCVELLPEVLSAETEAQGLDDDAIAAVEDLEIRGADVTGDTAVIDADNFPPEFAGAVGDTELTLKKIDDEWYVDLDNSFTTPTTG